MSLFKTNEWIIGIAAAVIIVGGCLAYGVNFGFGAQCKELGYTGADWEECVSLKARGAFPDHSGD